MTELQPYFNQVLTAVVVALAAFLAYFARRAVELLKFYVEARVDEYQLRILKEMAKTAVRELQQSPVFQDLDPAKKKEQAILWIKFRTKEMGLDVDENFLSSLVEEAVQVMKSEFKK